MLKRHLFFFFFFSLDLVLLMTTNSQSVKEAITALEQESTKYISMHTMLCSNPFVWLKLNQK